MKITRRKLAAAVLGPAAAAAAQNPPPAEAPLVKAARDRNQANFAAVAKVDLPMATEPAFQFKA
ncbi:MAG TPA: hypothetical protein VMI94_27020 [Bryobacteraceae bacterium]|jgi:hypothetical protein|nr:hypothetical protein [Bryobacteraceae bacterium]